MWCTSHLLFRLAHTTPSTLHWKGALPLVACSSLGHHRATSPMLSLSRRPGIGVSSASPPGGGTNSSLASFCFLAAGAMAGGAHSASPLRKKRANLSEIAHLARTGTFLDSTTWYA